MAEREHVLVREFGDSLYGKDAHIFNTPMTAQSTCGSPRSRLHGFGWGSFKNGETSFYLLYFLYIYIYILTFIFLNIGP